MKEITQASHSEVGGEMQREKEDFTYFLDLTSFPKCLGWL